MSDHTAPQPTVVAIVGHVDLSDAIEASTTFDDDPIGARIARGELTARQALRAGRTDV